MVSHEDPAAAKDDAAASEDDGATTWAKAGKDEEEEKVRGGPSSPSVRNLSATFWGCRESSGRSVVGGGRCG